MTVWVFNQFAGSPWNSSGAGERYHFLAKELKKSGVDLIIFSASYNHLFINQPVVKGTFSFQEIDDVKYCWVKIPTYNPDSAIGRVLSWMVFMWRLFFLPTKKMTVPNALIVSSMSMFPIYPAIFYRRKFKQLNKLIFEVRDIWPLTLIELGGISRFNPMILIMNATEWIAYKYADILISVLPNADKHIQKKIKSDKPVHWIPNGIDPDTFIDETLSPEIRSVFNGDQFKIVYAGAVGKANALEPFLDAYSRLQDPGRFKFIVIGSGPELINLKTRYNNIENIVFCGKIPKKQVLQALKLSDVLFIGWHNLSIYRFGVSANKYCDYMLAAKPIVSSGNLAFDPVRDAECGVVVDAENPVQIANAIEEMESLSVHERSKLGLNGYHYLIRNNTITVLASKYLKLLKA